MSTDNKKPTAKAAFSGRTKNVVVETKRKRVVVPKPGKSPSSAGISDAEMERRMKALQAAKAREAEESERRAAEEKDRAKARELRRDKQKTPREILIYEGITVFELADRLSLRVSDVAKALVNYGVPILANERLNMTGAALIVEGFGQIAVPEQPRTPHDDTAQDGKSVSEEEVSIALAIAALQKETTALKNSANLLAEAANKVLDHV